MGESSWKMCQITQGGVARKRQSGSPSFTRHLTPSILSMCVYVCVCVRERERERERERKREREREREKER